MMPVIGMLDEVRDTITGFTGTVTGICEYAYGSTQIRVTRTRDSGFTEPPEKIFEEWFEADRLELLVASGLE